MADFTQTITNQFELFGIAPSNKWGVMDWGDNWGNGSDVVVHIEHILGSQALGLTTTIVNSFERIVTVSTTLTSALPDRTLVDSEGFYHVFRGNTTDADDSVQTDFTEVTTSGTSWTAATEASTTWS